MEILCKNCGLNAAYAVVRCTIDEIEATFNKMSGIRMDGKWINWSPLSISSRTSVVLGYDDILILFKKTGEKEI